MRPPLAALAAVAFCPLLLACPALAFDAADADALSHFVGDAAQALGEAGETLRELKSGEFADVRGRVARGAVKARWNAATAPLRDSSAALRKSLPYKVAPTLFTISDTITSVLAPAIEGDYRGAMGNAANLAVAPTASGAGASLFGAVGTGIGATIGSFIPVVGTVAGGMVGGAIGTFAGGFVAASAYDRYVKDNLAGGLEAGIAALFDETPRQQAMDARHAFLYDTGADAIRAYWDNLRDTGLGPDEIELIGPELAPDIAIPKEAVPAPPPEAAAGDLLAGVSRFVLNPAPESDFLLACSIDAGQVTCSGRKDFGLAQQSISSSGVAVGNALDLTVRGTLQFRTEDGKCGYTGRHSATEHVVLESDGSARFTGSYSQEIDPFGDCGYQRTDSGNYDMVGTWQVVE